MNIDPRFQSEVDYTTPLGKLTETPPYYGNFAPANYKRGTSDSTIESNDSSEMPSLDSPSGSNEDNGSIQVSPVASRSASLTSFGRDDSSHRPPLSSQSSNSSIESEVLGQSPPLPKDSSVASIDSASGEDNDDVATPPTSPVVSQQSAAEPSGSLSAEPSAAVKAIYQKIVVNDEVTPAAAKNIVALCIILYAIGIMFTAEYFKIRDTRIMLHVFETTLAELKNDNVQYVWVNGLNILHSFIPTKENPILLDTKTKCSNILNDFPKITGWIDYFYTTIDHGRKPGVNIFIDLLGDKIDKICNTSEQCKTNKPSAKDDPTFVDLLTAEDKAAVPETIARVILLVATLIEVFKTDEEYTTVDFVDKLIASFTPEMPDMSVLLKLFDDPRENDIGENLDTAGARHLVESVIEVLPEDSKIRQFLEYITNEYRPNSQIYEFITIVKAYIKKTQHNPLLVETVRNPAPAPAPGADNAGTQDASVTGVSPSPESVIAGQTQTPAIDPRPSRKFTLRNLKASSATGDRLVDAPASVSNLRKTRSARDAFDPNYQLNAFRDARARNAQNPQSIGEGDSSRPIKAFPIMRADGEPTTLGEQPATLQNFGHGKGTRISNSNLSQNLLTPGVQAMVDRRSLPLTKNGGGRGTRRSHEPWREAGRHTRRARLRSISREMFGGSSE
jgi:hypothetical protein